MTVVYIYHLLEKRSSSNHHIVLQPSIDHYHVKYKEMLALGGGEGGS
jgi:hypothetical protein